MLRCTVAIFAVTLLLAGVAGVAYSHCEIPCGIYNDQTRVSLLKEHVTTIEKSMSQLEALSGKGDPQSINQIVRWVENKESHANEIQEIVTQYFLTQRVKAKPAGDAGHGKYVTQTTTLHQMLVAAMKCKQTVDKKHCAELRRLIDQFSNAYFSKADLDHMKQHKH
ncbi:MAG: superoxide dismutase [Ni] [Planctomycetota bacterium]